MQMKIVQERETLTHLALAGRLDISGAQAIEESFLDAMASRKKPVIVDMSEVTFLTSTGIHMLIRSAEIMKNCGAKVVLLNLQPLVAEVIRSAGIDRLISIADDESAALELLGIT